LKVTKADYLAKTLWIDKPWPASSLLVPTLRRGDDKSAAPAATFSLPARTPPVFEIGVPGHWTTYAALSVAPDGNGAKITVENGADYFRSPIEEVKPEEGLVRCALNPAMGNRPGINKGWVASDDEMKTFWRADLVADKTFKLTGAPVTKEAFGPAGVLRLWEYGVGDTVRQSTFASLRRVAPGEFELTADVDVELTLGNQTRKITAEEIEKSQGKLLIKR
jgi:hypothetical protein